MLVISHFSCVFVYLFVVGAELVHGVRKQCHFTGAVDIGDGDITTFFTPTETNSYKKKNQTSSKSRLYRLKQLNTIL